MKSSPEPSTKDCKEPLKGNIHSIESFGTVDGPGTRYVVFFQGCPMRCLYCHNPDTWSGKGGTPMTAEEILDGYERNKVFYRHGGITATGGEPLVQLPFLTELFQRAKEKGIHTCLDSSGVLYRREREAAFSPLFDALDLVLLDFKHSDEEGHIRLTGSSQKPVLEFARALEARDIPIVARHVLVPGITDGEEHLRALGRLLGSFQNLHGLEVLPYHTMGEVKYKELGISYPLEGIPAMEADTAHKAREILLEEIKKARGNKKKK